MASKKQHTKETTKKGYLAQRDGPAFLSQLTLPKPPKHAAPPGDGIGGTPEQEADALLYRVAHGAHRRRVEHVRARLREWVRVQSGMLELTLVDGWLARAARGEAGVDRWFERAAGCAETEEDLGNATGRGCGGRGMRFGCDVVKGVSGMFLFCFVVVFFSLTCS